MGTSFPTKRAALCFPSFPSVGWLESLTTCPLSKPIPFCIDGQEGKTFFEEKSISLLARGRRLKKEQETSCLEEVQNYLDSCVFILTGLNTGLDLSIGL